jgi:tetratricopeptide (TPR) repeat protein
MTTSKKLTGFIAIVFLSCFGLNAQTKNEVIEVYNQAIALMKTDVQGAIVSFEKSIQMSEQVGDSAKDLKEKAITVLPDLYYQKANKLYTDKKIPEAISASKDVIKVSEKYGNDKAKEKAQKLMVIAYSAQGNNYFKSNDNENAVKAFDSALFINPEYTRAMFNKALVYKKMDNAAKFTETIDLFISKSQADTAQTAQANKLALDYFRSSGAKLSQTTKLDDAITALNTSFKYGNDKDVYYYLALAYNKQKKFADGATNAQKGLDMETGTPEAKAKFNYELAVALAGKGDANACATFKNALFGPFLAPAKAQMTNLKCPGAAPAPAAK